jgi:hypothetical protein
MKTTRLKPRQGDVHCNAGSFAFSARCLRRDYRQLLATNTKQQSLLPDEWITLMALPPLLSFS